MDYDNLYQTFNWRDYGDSLFEWDWRKRFNITMAAVDRHARKTPDKIALRHIRPDRSVSLIDFARLKLLTDKYANALAGLGLEPGDRAARLLGRLPETYVGFFGAWKAGLVDVPLYTAFGPEAVAYRLADSGARVLLTDRENLAKLDSIKDGLKDLKIIVVDREDDETDPGPGIGFNQLLAEAPADPVGPMTTLDSPAILVYTSGTTGPPKGTEIRHRGIISVLPYAQHCLDVRIDDVYWGFADPGWTYGLLSAGSAILVGGGSLVVFEPRFTAEDWYKTLIDLKVTNFTAAPTAFRAIMAAGSEPAARYRPKLRYLSSAGEPLNPEGIHWFEKHFGLPVRDMYGITEVSMVIGNNPSFDLKPGSCGKPVPGFEVRLKNSDGHICGNGETGSIGVKQNDFFISSGYWGREEKWRGKFDDGWFDTGDLAYRDEDGYYFFVGREDDVISSSGYRIGPFEVESCIIEHQAVAECAVIGKPDELRGEIVKAFVVLNNGISPDDRIKQDIVDLCRNKLSKHNYPREIDFIDELPKTSSGKIQRRRLREMDRAVDIVQ